MATLNAAETELILLPSDLIANSLLYRFLVFSVSIIRKQFLFVKDL